MNHKYQRRSLERLKIPQSNYKNDLKTASLQLKITVVSEIWTNSVVMNALNIYQNSNRHQAKLASQKHRATGVPLSAYKRLIPLQNSIMQTKLTVAQRRSKISRKYLTFVKLLRGDSRSNIPVGIIVFVPRPP